MRISKPLIYCNILALVVNGIIVWLMAVKFFPPMLGICIFLGCVGAAIRFSCKVNNKLPKRARSREFYSAPTQEVERF